MYHFFVRGDAWHLCMCPISRGGYLHQRRCLACSLVIPRCPRHIVFIWEGGSGERAEMSNLWNTSEEPLGWVCPPSLTSHCSSRIRKVCQLSSPSATRQSPHLSAALRIRLSVLPAPATDLTAPSQDPLTKLQPSLHVRGSLPKRRALQKLFMNQVRNHLSWIWTSPGY